MKNQENTIMNKLFRSERLFHDSHGWYLSMRPSDASIVRNLPVPGGHHVDDHGLIVGPFQKRGELEKWFVNFVGRFGATRPQDLLSQPA